MGGCGTCGWLWHLWVVVALVGGCGTCGWLWHLWVVVELVGGCGTCGWLWHLWVVVALVGGCGWLWPWLGSLGCGSLGCGSHGSGSLGWGSHWQWWLWQPWLWQLWLWQSLVVRVVAALALDLVVAVIYIFQVREFLIACSISFVKNPLLFSVAIIVKAYTILWC